MNRELDRARTHLARCQKKLAQRRLFAMRHLIPDAENAVFAALSWVWEAQGCRSHRIIRIVEHRFPDAVPVKVVITGLPDPCGPFFRADSVLALDPDRSKTPRTGNLSAT